MTREQVLVNLKKLVGKLIDEEEIIIAFEDFEENDESSVVVNKSQNTGYDYIAYVYAEDTTQFLFLVEDNLITSVWLA